MKVLPLGLRGVRDTVLTQFEFALLPSHIDEHRGIAVGPSAPGSL